MAKKRRRKFYGIAEPVLAREPLLARLCAAFVDNFTLILRTAFVIGAVLLVQELRILRDEGAQPVAESSPAPVEAEVIDVPEAEIPVLSDGVQHALNCTYEDYRNAHYDECVKEPSGIYPRPLADPDDTGYVIYASPMLFARLDDYTGAE